MTDDSTVRFFAQKHGALQSERTLLNQLEALLTARDPRQFLDGGDCPVEAVADDDPLTLSATAVDVETGQVGARRSLRNRGEGSYATHLTLPGPGARRVTVGDLVNPGRVHEVSGIVLVVE